MRAPAILLLATSNPGKLREIRQILSGLPIEIKTLADFPDIQPPVEDEPTFEANALKKARHYARRTGLWTLADDSGLEVDALGGAPGVRSARYAGENAGDTANNAKLIAALAGVPAERRTARFRCAAVVSDGSRVWASAQGTVDGLIIDTPRGQNGFGYDPHFLLPQRGVTTAELPPEEKNRISHRGQAMRRIGEQLTDPLAK
ncbi:MAG TPA: XTP/dITP diphosphatase [Phycisphaerae bacterium]